MTGISRETTTAAADAERWIVTPDLEAVRAALREEGARPAAALRAGADLQRPVPGLDWTAGQLLTHLWYAYQAFASVLSGAEPDPAVAEVFGAGAEEPNLPTKLAAVNAVSVTAPPFTDAAGAAERLEQGVAALLAALDAPDLDLAAERPTPWYGAGVSLPLATLAALAVSETLVHGLDLDRALGRRGARLAPRHAATAAPTVMSSMLPLLLDPRAAGGRSRGYELRVRGGTPFVLRVADGRAWCEAAGGGAPVDCVISLTGEAALLIGFARRPLWRWIVSGQAFSYGRRPWLGLSFHKLFLTP